MRVTLLLFLLFILSNCAVYDGAYTNSSVYTKGEDVHYKDIALGYAKATYFFRIGGLGRNMLVSEAKRNMQTSYKLGNGESFENVSYDIRWFYFLPFIKTEVIVTADVVQRDTTNLVTYSNKYKDWISLQKGKSKDGELSLNEDVLFYNTSSNSIHMAKVIDLKYNRATLYFIKKDRNFKVKTISMYKLYKLVPPDKGMSYLKLGQIVELDKIGNGEIHRQGTIIGFGLNNNILVEFDDGVVRSVFENKIIQIYEDKSDE